MLEQPRADRPRTVAEIAEDMREFKKEFPHQAFNTRAIRNTYFGHFYKTVWLATMWKHVITCEYCKERYKQELKC